MNRTNIEETDMTIKSMTFLERRQRLISDLAVIGKKGVGLNGDSRFFRFAELTEIKSALDPLKIKYGITDIINFEGFPDKQPTISLYDFFDQKDSKPKIVFCAPSTTLDYQNTFMSPIQQAGAYMTYYRRYLLMLAYDIAADDKIDTFQNQQIPEANVPNHLPEFDKKLEEMENGHTSGEKDTQKEQKNISNDTKELDYIDDLLTTQKERQYPIDDQGTKINESVKNKILTSGTWSGQPLSNALIFGQYDYISDVANGLVDDVDDNTINICRAYVDSINRQ